ncbi:MAG: ATP-binding protein, partial [Longimicrobiales bacterium]
METSDHTSAGPSGLLSSLARLDTLLCAAAARVPLIYGAEAATDRFRGLYISADEVGRLLERPPGAPLFAEGADSWERAEAAEVETAAATGPEPTRLSWLAATYGLTSFDLDILVLALAPEIDVRYERIYAYLQDDVTRRRPTVDLALALLADDAHDRLVRRWHFAPGAPLVRERLVELVADSGHPAPTFLAHAIRVDEQVVNLLLEQDVLDTRLAPFCRVDARTDAHVLVATSPTLIEALARRVRRARDAREALRLEIVGPSGS